MRPSLRRLLSALALPLLALAFLAAVALSSVALRGARLDLTEDGLYTLSPGTVRILGKIDEPITLKLYYSDRAAADLPQFRLFASRVRELLEEMAARADGKLVLEVIDPEPFSEDEDQAAAYGLTALPLGSGQGSLYFGLVGLNSTDGETTMPFIQPDKEAFLEYDVAKLVSTLAVDAKPVVGLISGLPTGPGLDPASGRPTLGWVIDRQLSEFFELRRLQGTPSSIADDVDLLMVVHPKDLPEETQYAIDQFVLGGGRLLAFVDPDAEADPAGNLMDPTQMSEGRGSDMAALFKGWGIAYDPARVVLDSKHALQVQPPGSAAPVRHLAVVGLGEASLNQDDVVTADLENVHFSSAGALALAEGASLRLEALAQSSGASAATTVDRVRGQGQADPASLYEGFEPRGEPFVLAARLTGPLKSAFPGRKSEGHLAQSKGDVNIVLVADTDVLSDRLWVQVQEFLGQPVFNAFANNGDFVFNAVDNLVGNADLIAVRTRAASQRPFERVAVLRRAAEERYRSKETELQQQLEALEQKLAELQPTGPDGQAKPLTVQQQAGIVGFQEDKLRIRKELREVQRQLNAEITALGSRLKLVNILGMPALVILVALLVAGLRASRRRAADRN